MRQPCFVVAFLLVSSCALPEPAPAGVSPAAGDSATTGPPASATNTGAMCQDALRCYGECPGLNQGCVTACERGFAPTQVAQSRAVLRCVEQSGCADQACAAQRCANELAACTGTPVAVTEVAAAPTPAPSAPAGTAQASDLVFQVPPGWSSSQQGDTVTLARDEQVQAGTDFYGTRHYRLLILPSRPLEGTLTTAFHAIWTELVVPSYTLTIDPAPMRRRLRSGLACDFDGGEAIDGNGNRGSVVLYACAIGKRVVPLLGIYQNSDDNLETTLVTMLDNAAIRGESTRLALYLPSELTGQWTTSSTSIGTYVGAGGGYAGDASIATSESYDLRADGTYSTSFAGVRGSGGSVRSSSTGRWRLDDDSLVLEPTGDRAIRLRVFGAGQSPAEVLVLAQSFDPQSIVELSRPRRGLHGVWYGRPTK